ncbi:MAG TPA: AMP-binding protein [Planctomycetota bacterium]
MDDILWRPSPEAVERANVTRFMRAHGMKDYDDLIRRCAADTSWFWDAALKDLGVIWDRPYEKVQEGGFPWAKWFVGGKLNIVSNCIERGRGAKPAVLWNGDDGRSRAWSYAELELKVARIAGALLREGLKPGDTVGIYMPMIPEIVAVFFACLKIGAVAVPVFSAFGAPALAVRLQDAEAKILFTADGVSRRGKQAPLKPEADKAVAECPTLRKVVVFPRLGIDVPMGPKDVAWNDFLRGVPEKVPTVSLDAEATALIIYTSGTTGKPKGTVHTHAGVLAQTAKELGYGFDVKAEDVFFWVTDIGWMMGPWEMIGVTFFGATLVLFEGAPNYPNPDRLWEIVEKDKVTHLGISPTAIRLLKSCPTDWVTRHDVSSLRILGSTGEAWDPDSYHWFFENVGGKRCPIINISGGTEIMGCHLMPLPITPLKACTLRGPGLGMDVDVFDDDGKPIRGGIGHLVCKKPAPSMTKGFLKDPQRYLDTYFAKFPGVWYHGDWAKVDADGYWFLYGRSDDTIKVAGKRVGPAEVESALIEHADVAEAAAIGVPHELKGETIVCFVVLKPGRVPSEPLRDALHEQVVKHLGKTLKPEAVKFVKLLPKTRSAKIVRGTIKKRYLNQPLGDTASVENLDAIEEIGRAT